VGAPVLQRAGPMLYLVEPGGATTGWRAGDAETVARGWPDGLTPEVLAALRTALRGRSVASDEPALTDAVRRGGIPLALPGLRELRSARESLPRSPAEGRREFALALARARVTLVLASDEAACVALAREEERVARALGRDQGAKDAFLAPPTGELADHLAEWTVHQQLIARHHAALERRLERLATRVLPNLASLVGPRVAARLLARAGDRATLGRMSASRLQLLGARRRPGDRGPRFGVIYRAHRMEEIPPDRQGRYARSLAALAAIAARTDASSGRDLRDWLVARRDRRIAQLRRGR
jgi:hypothetical protein